MATTLERVRRTISDKPTFRRQVITATGATRYQLEYAPISGLVVSVDGAEKTVAVDYTADLDNGVVEFINVPAANSELLFTYYSVVWTDAELNDFLSVYGDNVNITSAHVLMSWAADVARLAKRETRSGGGGLGAVTIDTSVAARELRNTASAIMEWEREYGDEAGTAIPAEGLTEIPWTEAAYEESAYQRLIRES